MTIKLNQEENPSDIIRPINTLLWLMTYVTIIFSLTIGIAVVLVLREEKIPGSSVALSGIVYFLVLVALIPCIFITSYLKYDREKAHETFWKRIASKHDWDYWAWDTVPQRALIFQEGSWRLAKHFVKGSIDEHPFRIFEYRFFGSIRKLGFYQQTIVEFTFSGTFPHSYLCSKENIHMFEYGTRIPLPAFIEQIYALYSAKEYEMEALQVFTPDILQLLSQQNTAFDIELVDHTLLLIRPDLATSIEQVEEQFNLGQEIAKRLSNLDYSKLEKIGSYDPKLKQIFDL